MQIDPSSPRQAQELLNSHGLRAQKRLGQNFLCDKNILDKIVRGAELTSSDRVVEIGGGMGALTLALSAATGHVTTVEIDQLLRPILEQVVADRHNVSLVFEDFLRLDIVKLFDEAFGDSPGTVVANIPYYITTPILEQLLIHKKRLKKIVLLVQQEFAARMTAPAGSDECGAMSLYAQYHANIELVGIVPKTVFLPQPEVNSAIIALTPVIPGTVSVSSETRLFYLTRAAFGQRRKTLLNALMRAPASFGLGFNMDSRKEVEELLLNADIDGTRRGETLNLTEFARLTEESLILHPIS